MKKAAILFLLGLVVLAACQSQTQTDSSSSSSSESISTYFEVISNPIEITTDNQYEVALNATDM